MLRLLINTLFPSTLIFSDGSRLDYLIREDCLRYVTPGPTKEMVEVPLVYNATQKKSRLDPSSVWQWTKSGRVLTEQEKSELLVKIEAFMKKRPKEFVV